MDPASVARLLAAMEPNEAVVILSALGDQGGRLVAEVLPSDARAQLIKVGLDLGSGLLPGAWGWRLGAGGYGLHALAES